MKKNYYCEYCKKYPDNFTIVVEGEKLYKWNGREYELDKTWLEEKTNPIIPGDQPVSRWCAECGHKLLNESEK